MEVTAEKVTVDEPAPINGTKNSKEKKKPKKKNKTKNINNTKSIADECSCINNSSKIDERLQENKNGVVNGALHVLDCNLDNSDLLMKKSNCANKTFCKKCDHLKNQIGIDQSITRQIDQVPCIGNSKPTNFDDKTSVVNKPNNNASDNVNKLLNGIHSDGSKDKKHKVDHLLDLKCTEQSRTDNVASTSSCDTDILCTILEKSHIDDTSHSENSICDANIPTESSIASTSPDVFVNGNAIIEYKVYENELQMPDIMRLIQKDLSEPYSIYTYRYFIHNWPKLCFLAMHGDICVGAIVCKLDIHRQIIKRGYIAMLAVDKDYRKLKIGTNLVQKAIQAMLVHNADEVVLETEITNIPALRLYENLGFVRDKRLFGYYLNGVDALRLKLWFR